MPSSKVMVAVTSSKCVWSPCMASDMTSGKGTRNKRHWMSTMALTVSTLTKSSISKTPCASEFASNPYCARRTTDCVHVADTWTTKFNDRSRLPKGVGTQLAVARARRKASVVSPYGRRSRYQVRRTSCAVLRVQNGIELDYDDPRIGSKGRT